MFLYILNSFYALKNNVSIFYSSLYRIILSKLIQDRNDDGTHLAVSMQEIPDIKHTQFNNTNNNSDFVGLNDTKIRIEPGSNSDELNHERDWYF